MKKLFLYAACSLLLSLAGCGGGGGGGTDTSFRVTFSAASLNFEVVEGKVTGASASKVVTATANTSTTRSVYIGAEAVGQGIASPILVDTGAAPLTSNIVVAVDPAIKAGSYSGKLRLLACTSSACSEHYPGSPQEINYTIKVLAPIKPSLAAVTFSAPEGGASETVPLSVKLPEGYTDLSYKVTYPATPAAGQWLKITKTTDGLSLLASASGLAAGTYTTTLELVAAQADLSTKVPVTFTVTSGVVLNQTVQVDVGSLTLPASLKGSIPISSQPGVTATTWTATTTTTWLKLDVATGKFGESLVWHIDTAAMGLLANNATHTGTATVAMTGIASKVITFKLNMKLAQLRSADTFAMLPGRSDVVMVYGAGFDAIDHQSAAIRVGNFAPASISKLSDKVLALTMPALEAGTYDVTLSNAAGLAAPKVPLKVLATQTYPYQALATTGDKASMLWNGENKSLYVVNAGQKSVMRFTAGATGTFTLASSRTFANGIDAVGLNRDHTALIVSTQGSTFNKVSVTDLSDLVTPPWKLGDFTATLDYHRNPLPVLGDNRVLTSNYSMLDLETGAVTPNTQAFPSLNGLLPYGGVTRDGNIVLISNNPLALQTPLTVYTLTSGQFRQLEATSSVDSFTRNASSRNGRVWAQNNVVFDDGHRKLGLLTPPAGWANVAMAVSRTGSRTYTYATSTGALPRVYVFDTLASVGATTDLPIMGFMELADRPDCDGAPALPGCIPNVAQMRIADDDLTLFIMGDRMLVVQPIDSAYVAPVPVPVVRAQMMRWQVR